MRNRIDTDDDYDSMSTIFCSANLAKPGKHTKNIQKAIKIKRSFFGQVSKEMSHFNILEKFLPNTKLALVFLCNLLPVQLFHSLFVDNCHYLECYYFHDVSFVPPIACVEA